jgi:hypothetical protein
MLIDFAKFIIKTLNYQRFVWFSTSNPRVRSNSIHAYDDLEQPGTACMKNVQVEPKIVNFVKIRS